MSDESKLTLDTIYAAWRAVGADVAGLDWAKFVGHIAAQAPAEGDATLTEEQIDRFIPERIGVRNWGKPEQADLFNRGQVRDAIRTAIASQPNVQPKAAEVDAAPWSKTVESAALLLQRCTGLELQDCDNLAGTILGMAANVQPKGTVAANYIVSVVMTKQNGYVVNTQNKLYGVEAVSPDEAHGKAVALAQVDFPEHQFHTACHWLLQAPAPAPDDFAAHTVLSGVARRKVTDMIASGYRICGYTMERDGHRSAIVFDAAWRWLDDEQRHTLMFVEGSRVQAPAVQDGPALTYSSTQATKCAGCGEHKHTPLRVDAMGGYVCLTCIDKKLGGLLGEFGYEDDPQRKDAERYRFIRNADRSDSFITYDELVSLSMESLDRAIDEAMNAESDVPVQGSGS